MNIEQIKEMLIQTQRLYGPHYPSKTWDNNQKLNDLIKSLANIVDILGFSDANIAIKNDIARVISQFLVNAGYRGVIIENGNVQLGGFSVESVEIQEEKKLVFTIDDLKESNKLEIIYNNNGTITLNNQIKFNCYTNAEPFNNTLFLYDSDNPNEILQSTKIMGMYPYTYKSVYNEQGIEIMRDFDIMPIGLKNFENNNRIKGALERSADDFNITICNAEIIGDLSHDRSFRDITHSELDDNKIIDLPIITPELFKGRPEFETDVNKLNLNSESVTKCLSNALFLKKDSEAFADEKNMAIESFSHMICLEIGSPWGLMCRSIIHTPYSQQIFESVKNYTKSQNQEKK